MKPDLSYDTDQLLPELLKVVPEIEEKVRADKGWMPTDEERQELNEIAKMHGLPLLPESGLLFQGMTIIFENILVPQIIEFVKTNAHDRLVSVMGWIEELANHKEFNVRNMVGVCICENLLTNEAAYFSRIYPYLGKQTIEDCKIVSTGFRVRQEILDLLGIERKKFQEDE